ADPRAEPRARGARARARGERSESDRGPDHEVLRVDVVRVPPHALVRPLDRSRGRALPVRVADDDRLAGGDLPVDVRDDQPEPGRREAPGRRRPAVADRPGGGQAEPGAHRPLEPDPRADEGGSRLHDGPLERRADTAQRGRAKRSRVRPQLTGEDTTLEQRPILICYDGSADARRAISAAADLLSHRPAVALEVTPPLTVEEEEASLLTPASPDIIESRIRDVGRLAHRGAQLARGAGLDADERIDVAAPTWQGVVQAADEIEAAVIVVGSRG